MPPTRPKSSPTIRGISPAASLSASRSAIAAVPIVCVLPLPVCPYASTVALKPPSTPSMSGRADSV